MGVAVDVGRRDYGLKMQADGSCFLVGGCSCNISSVFLARALVRIFFSSINVFL